MALRLRTTTLRCVPAIALAMTAGLASADKGGDDNRALGARLSGYQEVPVVSTTGSGEFRGKIDGQTGEIDYEFSYSGMQGEVRQAHIHLGQRGVNGAIMVWLCQSVANPAPPSVAATTPECGATAATFSGRITAASVIGQPAIVSPPATQQQLGAGELSELVKALRAGVAYVNVHTSLTPSGEIRGQIGTGHRH